jgi:probable phosphoglycerate mutase
MSSWPACLWLVRHGESAGNVARDAAERAGLSRIEIAGRDMDVPLSALGERQSRAVGTWFARRQPAERPSVVLCSPYLRARQTAELIVQEAQLGSHHVQAVDERLREKEFGALNRLTKAGIAATFPREAALRAEVGKFYYRPPGGESWCDVILRLRSVLHHVHLRYGGARVLLVAHQVIVLCFRYLLEDLDEQQLLDIDRSGDVANCAVTTFESALVDGQERMVLREYNFVAPVEQAGEPVTQKPDPSVLK